MIVQEAIDEYRYAILQLSEATQIWYLARLKRFAVWCEEEKLTLDKLKPTSVARYLQHLAEQPHHHTGQPISTYTLHGHARSIRTFLFWCAMEPQSYLSLKIPENIVMPKITQKIIETFTPIQIKKLFAATEKEKFKELVIRDKAILAVLLDTGIRAGELCGLTLDCCHIPSHGHAFLKVVGKGDKEREVPLGKQSRVYLYSYIKSYRQAASDEFHVFLGHHRKPLTTSGLDIMLYRLARWAKVEGVRVSAHTFRHTFACQHLLQGGEIYMLSRLLGHTSVQVTEQYLRAIKSQQARMQSKSVLDNL